MENIVDNNHMMNKFMGSFEEDPMWYHSEWDWLMPVVEEIERIVEESEQFGSLSFYMISLADLRVTDKNNKVLFKFTGNANRHNRLEKNWECCVAFIKWWNEIE